MLTKIKNKSWRNRLVICSKWAVSEKRRDRKIDDLVKIEKKKVRNGQNDVVKGVVTACSAKKSGLKLIAKKKDLTSERVRKSLAWKKDKIVAIDDCSETEVDLRQKT